MFPHSSQAPRDEGDLQPKHRVFLSHSGAQKGFVEQLCKDLEGCDRFPYFDKRRDSLPEGEHFPPLIYKAIQQCQVGVVILSEDFMISKWPMLELVEMVKTTKERPDEMMIVPIFLSISCGDLGSEENLRKWEVMWAEFSKDERISILEWKSALKLVKKTNGLVYKPEVGEVKFREEIVEEICKIVPPFHTWDDSHVQGWSRLSKCIRAKICCGDSYRVVGLYGVGGIGKSTACKSLCKDFYMEFHGRVCHVEFGNDTTKESRLQAVLMCLTNTSNEYFKDSKMDEWWDRLKNIMHLQRVFLAIDNVSDNSMIIEEVQKYLNVGYCRGSIVMVTARGLGELRNVGIGGSDCLEMPELEVDEARALFVYHAHPKNEVEKEVLLECINRCRFSKGDGCSVYYHPLALKVLGSQLASKDPKEWKLQLKMVHDIFNLRRERENPVFSILRRSFDELMDVDKLFFTDGDSQSSLNAIEVLPGASASQLVGNKEDHLNIHTGKQPEYEANIGMETSSIKTNKPSLMAIASEMFQSISDETYIKVLQDEFIEVAYISELLNDDNNSGHQLFENAKTTLFFYFNDEDDMFEYYFKDYASMACILGVGLEYGKVLLEDGWRLKVKETSKQDWEHAWKNCDSTSNTMKVTIQEPHVACMDNEENLQENPTFIPRGRSLLLDIVKYFILKSTIAYANNSGAGSSSSQVTNRNSTNTGAGIGDKFIQALRNIFIPTNAFKQGNTKISDTLEDLPSSHETRDNATVYLELLPGGCFSHATNLDDELTTLASQLDNTIISEMKFTFIKEDDRKEIQVTVGPISFQLREEDEENYMTLGRFGWFHKSLDVSFGVVNAECAKLCTYEALKVKEVKEMYTTSCTDTTTKGTAKIVTGGVDAIFPQFCKVTLSGSNKSSAETSVSKNALKTIEEVFQYTEGGFSISQKPSVATSKLRYTYLPRDYMRELDHGKLSDEDHRKKVGCLPICIPQDVKFQGTWRPNDVGNDSLELVKYTFEASRVVEMTSKKSLEAASKKRSWSFRHGKQQGESGRNNDPLTFTQKHIKNVFLNHSMTHLDGRVYKVRERLNQRPLNQMDSETFLTEEGSLNAPSWSGNPLVELN